MRGLKMAFLLCRNRLSSGRDFQGHSEKWKAKEGRVKARLHSLLLRRQAACCGLEKRSPGVGCLRLWRVRGRAQKRL